MGRALAVLRLEDHGPRFHGGVVLVAPEEVDDGEADARDAVAVVFDRAHLIDGNHGVHPFSLRSEPS